MREGFATQEDRNSIVVDTMSVESSDSSPPTGEEVCSCRAWSAYTSPVCIFTRLIFPEYHISLHPANQHTAGAPAGEKAFMQTANCVKMISY